MCSFAPTGVLFEVSLALCGRYYHGHLLVPSAVFNPTVSEDTGKGDRAHRLELAYDSRIQDDGFN